MTALRRGQRTSARITRAIGDANAITTGGAPRYIKRVVRRRVTRQIGRWFR